MIYRGFSLYSTPNDPGVLIRELPEPHLTIGKVIGSANSFWEGQAWIDNLIDSGQQPDNKPPDGPPWGPGGKPKPP